MYMVLYRRPARASALVALRVIAIVMDPHHNVAVTYLAHAHVNGDSRVKSAVIEIVFGTTGHGMEAV